MATKAPTGTRRTSTTPAARAQQGSSWSLLRDSLERPMASWYLVLVSAGLLVALGLLMVLSASSVYSQTQFHNNPYYIAERQVLFLVIGLPLAWWLSHQDEGRLKLFGWVVFLASLVMLLLVFVPGLGSNANKGNQAWLKVGPLSLQPSEFAKLGLVVWSAAVVSAKEKVLDRPRELAPLGVGFALVLLLVLAEKDLGTALVIAAIVVSILWVIGVPGRMLGALGGIGAIGVFFLVVTSPNRMVRVMNFLTGHASTDPNASQQPLSAIYGLASGGWWGLGLGRSRQKWGNLNDGAQNDFVFAVLGEEMGLFGSLVVLALFAVLGWAGMRIAMRSESVFCRVVASGATAWLMFQAMMNIGVAMGMLPVIGVPLPFISAGGSALMSNLMAVGVLLACARQEPAAREALEQRRIERRERRRNRGAGPRGPRVTTVVGGR